MFDKWQDFFKKESAKASANQVPASDSTKCYLTIASTEPGTDFDIMGFLAGEHNRFYVNTDKPDQPSINFEARCRIFTDLEDLFANTKGEAKGKTPSGMFILVAPYDQNKLREFVAKGKFNEAIQKAYNYKEAIKNGGSDAIKSNRIESINNPHFVTIKKISSILVSV